MKAGRPTKRAADYANARAVETAMLSLAHAGNEWPSPKEIIAQIRSADGGSPRVVWNRGRARMLSEGRLLVQAKLDERKRGVERYQLKYVEGRPPKPIRLEEYQRLPEDVRRFFRAVPPEEERENARRTWEGIGTFLQSIEKVATPVVLNGLTYADLLAEMDRRRQIWARTFVHDLDMERDSWERRRTDPRWWPPEVAAFIPPYHPPPPKRKIRLPTVAVEPPTPPPAGRHTPIRR
jgi:hypothetical protein